MLHWAADLGRVELVRMLLDACPELADVMDSVCLRGFLLPCAASWLTLHCSCGATGRHVHAALFCHERGCGGASYAVAVPARLGGCEEQG